MHAPKNVEDAGHSAKPRITYATSVVLLTMTLCWQSFSTKSKFLRGRAGDSGSRCTSNVIVDQGSSDGRALLQS